MITEAIGIHLSNEIPRQLPEIVELELNLNLNTNQANKTLLLYYGATLDSGSVLPMSDYLLSRGNEMNR